MRVHTEISNINFKELIDLDRGLISRKIFTDEYIYKLELERIFSKAWLFVTHESLIREKGDYITTYMGNDSVIVLRDYNNQIRVFLNECRHRGMKICRSEKGNQSFFTCPYHGWTYKNDGRLIGVPLQEIAYGKDFNKENWGLIEAPNIINYKGFIFATWNHKAPTFEEYLGGMKYYIDLLIDRFEGHLTVYGGIQKWLIPVNWKVPAENFIGDSYHAPITHKSAVDLKLRPPYSKYDLEISFPEGHGFGTQVGGIGRGIEEKTEHAKLLKESIDKLANYHGNFIKKVLPMGHIGIFPNFSILDLWFYTFIRVWHPRAHNLTEVNSFLVVDERLSESEKRRLLRKYLNEFGPMGLFDQDDAEIWSQVTDTNKGYIAENTLLNFEAGLKKELPASEVLDPKAAGIVGTPFGDQNQRMFYKRWLQYMTYSQ